MYKRNFENQTCGNCGGENLGAYHCCISCRWAGEHCKDCRAANVAEKEYLRKLEAARHQATEHLLRGIRVTENHELHNWAVIAATMTQGEVLR